MEDSQILALLTADGDRALEALYDKYYAYLCQAAYRIVADRQAAEDIVQDTFFELWKKRRRINVSVSLRAYLRRSAVNRSLNYLRDRKPELSQGLAMPDMPAGAAGHPAADRFSAEELQQAIDRAIDGLPERCRLVFVLSRFEEMSHREIARLLDISPKTVENQIGKALTSLRQALKPYLLYSLWAAWPW
jgi:RNA polymerase sigma-70 factor (ECF subfamily)